MHFECDISSIHFPHPREDFAGKFVGTYAVDTSIHFPHPREDIIFLFSRSGNWLLQSTSLIRGKTTHTIHWRAMDTHFNPLPSSEGRPADCSSGVAANVTSIHFPHPREDHPGERQLNLRRILQSTSLIRGKTFYADRSDHAAYTSIHFPHPRED